MDKCQSEQINELVGAIVKAQLAMVPASKDHVNPFFKSKYADLPSCWEATACFRENGIAIVQSPMEGPEGYVLLDTQLSHVSGQWMRSRLKIRIAKDDPQGYGSAITYARRYALGCMTGLVTEEDDDGNAASNPQPQTRQFTQHKQTAQSKINELRNEGLKPEPSGALSLEALATIYDKHNSGRPARTLPIDTVTEWAATRKDMFKIGADDCFYLVKPEPQAAGTSREGCPPQASDRAPAPTDDSPAFIWRVGTKHKGESIRTIPDDYLTWFAENGKAADHVQAVNDEIDRRMGQASADYGDGEDVA